MEVRQEYLIGSQERRTVALLVRLEGKNRRRLSLSADRCENRGAERLAGETLARVRIPAE
jgi:hypothetical protein